MIKISNLTKVFTLPDRDVVAADRISMEIQDGEVCVLLGPSGCGKTTILKMLNGLIPKTSGKIEIDGRSIDGVDIVELRRSIGYVIQHVGLFPNMTIEQNISLVPKLLGWDKRRSRERARELLSMMGLDPAAFLDRYPRELSGGQQQRVGVARAIAADPPILIMDEPFGAIDPINREAIQDQFLLMQEQLRKTIVFVSHDIDEAVKMADRIALFRAGRLEQFASPDEMLAHPANDFVADFVGSDRTLKRLPLVKVGAAANTQALRAMAGDDATTIARAMQSAGVAHVTVCSEIGAPMGTLTLKQAEAIDGPINGAALAPSHVIRMSDNLRTAVSIMFTHDVTALACVDDQGHFTGEITQARITHHLGATYVSPRLP